LVEKPQVKVTAIADTVHAIITVFMRWGADPIDSVEGVRVFGAAVDA
jgi:hypothetical protein